MTSFRALPVLAVLLLAAVVGTFSLDGGFVYDDARALANNPVVNGAMDAGAALDHDFWGAPLDGPIRSYRPLLPLLWHGLWSLFPGAPLPFRLLSLGLHVLATAAVLQLLGLVLASRRAVLWGAALFAVHPVHAEAVGAIVSQADLLSAALGCVALLVGIASARRAALCAFLLLLACAAKEGAVVFGAALLARALCDARSAGAKLPVLRLLPSLLVLLAVSVLQLGFTRTGGIVLPDSLARSLSGGMRVLYGLHVIGHGTLLTLLPYALAPHRGYAAVQPTLDSLLGFGLLGAAALCAAITCALLAWRRHNGGALAMLVLWLGPLLLQSGFVVTPMTDVVDRLLYTPSIAASYGLGLALTRVEALGLASKARLQQARRIATAGLVLVFALASFAAQRAWTSDLALWQRAVSVQPRSWQARKNLAAYLTQAGRPRDAAWHFLVSLHLVRRYPKPIDYDLITALEQQPLMPRLELAPALLEPQDPCALVRAYLGNMRKSAPELVQELAPRYAAHGCK